MKRKFFSPGVQEMLLILAYSAIVLGAFILFVFNSPYYYRLAAEDSFIENLTALTLFATAMLCAFRAIHARRYAGILFYFAACLLFLFGSGEEISWGQRFFGFDTPETIQAYNEQGEFTVHNLQLLGIRFNKIIFGVVLYWSLFSYFLLCPLLYRRSRRFRTMAIALYLPIPKWRQSLLYAASFSLMLFIPKENHEWEFQELMLSAYLFVSFLFPQNQNERQAETATSLSMEQPLQQSYTTE